MELYEFEGTRSSFFLENSNGNWRIPKSAFWTLPSVCWLVNIDFMENRFYEISSEDKRDLIERIKAGLRGRPDIIFAYLHGSFITGHRFRDIDVAIYLKPFFSSSLPIELEMEGELSEMVSKYPVEVRILNNAPLSFRYNVLKQGELIIVLDDDLRCDFAEATLTNYFDFAPFRRIYLKEALGSGI